MHLTPHEIKAYSDAELSAEARAQAARHFETCPHCRSTLQQLQEESAWVYTRLSTLEPAAPVPVHQARSRLAARLSSQKESLSMKTRIRRRALPLAAAAFLIALFAVPSVRAAAVDILGLFRVQQVEVVAFNPANLPANLESSLRNYEPLLSNQVAFSGGGEAIRVATPEEASEMAGFPVRIPVGVDNFLLTVQPAAQAVITVDVDVWQALLDEVGRSDLVLPAGLDGEAITIRLPSSVTFVSGDCALATPESGGPRAHQIDCLVVVQMPSPEVEAPAGLPVDELGRIFVEFLGLSPEEAERFSREIDWTTTLVIPVPNTARYQEAVVNGATAFRFSNTFESGVANHSLIWVEGEIVYSLMLNGDYRANEALAIARGLR